jgi:hypothetical protein
MTKSPIKLPAPVYNDPTAQQRLSYLININT